MDKRLRFVSVSKMDSHSLRVLSGATLSMNFPLFSLFFLFFLLFFREGSKVDFFVTLGSHRPKVIISGKYVELYSNSRCILACLRRENDLVIAGKGRRIFAIVRSNPIKIIAIDYHRYVNIIIAFYYYFLSIYTFRKNIFHLVF